MERYNRGAGAASAPTPPSAPANAYFTEGNPSLGVPATQPGPWWFHMITEEMRKVITDAGLTPDHTDLTQLSAAIQAMITASLAPDASETVKGMIEIATDAEAQALSDDVRALTPKKLDDALKGSNQSLAASGYQKLPGGLIFQWAQVGDGSTITTDTPEQYSFPIAFPNTCFVVVATLKRATAVNGGWSVYANIDSLSQFTFVWEQAAAGSNFLKNGYVFAVGN